MDNTLTLKLPKPAAVSSMRLLGRVLVACEYSGSVRDAFAALGWDAWSCDLLPSEKPGNHHQCDVREILDEGWDIMVAHPPCTHLAVSGARWFKAKVREQAEALDFVRCLLAAPIPHIALENPVSVISSKIRKPDQVIQPWQHGHGETKATCLWLKNLPRLTPSNIVEGVKAACGKCRRVRTDGKNAHAPCRVWLKRWQTSGRSQRAPTQRSETAEVRREIA